MAGAPGGPLQPFPAELQQWAPSRRLPKRLKADRQNGKPKLAAGHKSPHAGAVRQPPGTARSQWTRKGPRGGLTASWGRKAPRLPTRHPRTRRTSRGFSPRDRRRVCRHQQPKRMRDALGRDDGYVDWLAGMTRARRECGRRRAQDSGACGHGPMRYWWRPGRQSSGVRPCGSDTMAQPPCPLPPHPC
jgi:hypothetical protein